VSERIRVVVDGEALADSTRAVRVLETAGAPVYYLPPDDVRMDRLVPSPHRTFCEWKGDASYWSYEQGGRRIPNVAWAYPAPLPAFESIRDWIAFYAQLVDEAWV